MNGFSSPAHRSSRDVLRGQPKTSAVSPDETPWHTRSSEEVLNDLGSTTSGLDAAEAKRRFEEQGPNTIKVGRSANPWVVFLGQFKSVIVVLLMVAGIVAAFLGEVIDASAIFAIVVLNGVVGFYQEYTARKSIEALMIMGAPRAKVLRAGEVVLIPVAEIVRGDILALEAGDVISADARLLHCASLRCSEATLTGENEAKAKNADTLSSVDIVLADRKNMVFSGTNVAAGTGQGVVVGTGFQTQLGRIAGMLEAGQDERGTPLQKKLDSFGLTLVYWALGIIAVLFGVGWLRGVGFLELTMISISLAVAAVPEGLPAVVTAALALGAKRMSGRNAIVRKLAVVEVLGSTNVICTDKTGTLTVGAMTARSLYLMGHRYELTGEGYAPTGMVEFEGKAAGPEHETRLLAFGRLLSAANDAEVTEEDGSWTFKGDPTEAALLVAGTKLGVDRASFAKNCPLHQDFPFDADRKRSSVVRRASDGSLELFVNGAPDAVLKVCKDILVDSGVRPLTAEDRLAIVAENDEMTRRTLRVIGSAYRPLREEVGPDTAAESVERDLVFVGLTGMRDPPRGEAKVSIEKCEAAGIRVVMITGDHPQTARAVAEEIGLRVSEAEVLSGDELEKLSEEELKGRVEKIGIYARVTAAHKLRIVRAWQSVGSVVAMTGDGVNDAPAIQGADIGISMGKSGTEVTKEASDMILVDDNFATIVNAVEEGRGIYENIQKTLQYLLAGNTAELLLMTVCLVIGLPSPLLPIHLLWINLATDGLPALCLATDRISPDVMMASPRSRSSRLVDPEFLFTMLGTGGLTAGVAFFVFYEFVGRAGVDVARTATFAVLVFAELLRSFGARSSKLPVWKMSLLQNPQLLAVVAGSLVFQVLSQQSPALQAFFSTTPLGCAEVLLLFGLGLIPLVALEIVKVILPRLVRSEVR